MSGQEDAGGRGRGRPPVGPIVKASMPAELIALLDEAAAANGRSRSAEIVARLERSFRPGRRRTG